MIIKDYLTKDEAKSLIGKKYVIQGKRQDIATITDVYFVSDINDNLVGYQINSKHTFLGREIVNYDIAYASIKRGLIK